MNTKFDGAIIISQCSYKIHDVSTKAQITGVGTRDHRGSVPTPNIAKDYIDID